MKQNGKTKRWDAIFIASLLILAAVLYFFFVYGRDEGGVAVVTVDGVITDKIPLDHNGDYDLNGGSNVLRIKNGSACMIEAACPDHICVDTGEIRYEGQMIVCLPNHLVVTIEGVKGDADLYIG